MKEKYTKAKMNISIEEDAENGLKTGFGFMGYFSGDEELNGEIGVGGSTNTAPTLPDD